MQRCGIPSFPRKRESTAGSPRHARTFKSALGSAFAGTTLGDAVDVTPLGGPAKAGTVTDQ